MPPVRASLSLQHRAGCLDAAEFARAAAVMQAIEEGGDIALGDSPRKGGGSQGVSARAGLRRKPARADGREIKGGRRLEDLGQPIQNLFVQMDADVRRQLDDETLEYLARVSVRELARIYDMLEQGEDPGHILVGLLRRKPGGINPGLLAQVQQKGPRKDQWSRRPAPGPPRPVSPPPPARDSGLFGDVKGDPVVFCIDKSGSMNVDYAGQRVLTRDDICCAELEKELRKLAATKRFNVVTYAGGARRVFPDVVHATRQNVDAAMQSVRGERPESGGTNALEALVQAYSLPTPPEQLYFLTDGLPDQEPGSIVRAATGMLDSGRGIIVNTIAFMAPGAEEYAGAEAFLRRLADATGGSFRQAQPSVDAISRRGYIAPEFARALAASQAAADTSRDAALARALAAGTTRGRAGRTREEEEEDAALARALAAGTTHGRRGRSSRTSQEEQDAALARALAASMQA